MISRRLTKTQKSEILHSYRDGENTNFLAEKYSCTTNTINRTVKTMLTEKEYKLLKQQRSKISNNKIKSIDNQILKENNEGLSIEIEQVVNDIEVKKMSSLSLDNDFCEELFYENKDNNFELIEPLFSDFDFDEDKQKDDFEILNYESLPESVYMIVDKKVELDLQLISNLPDWSFLPENELNRNAILLFSNQRSAKRSCSRNQRVIKIPNTSIFKLSKPYLISKGITRLILDDSIIALDN